MSTSVFNSAGVIIHSLRPLVWVSGTVRSLTCHPHPYTMTVLVVPVWGRITLNTSR